MTIHSRNRYQSGDLDFVTYSDMKAVSKALIQLGLKIKGKYFMHDDCPWFVEFVSPPIAIGEEPVEEFDIHETQLGTIRLLRPVDSVKDRLASFYHWDDRQGLDQALDICAECEIDLKVVEKWSFEEGHLEKFSYFQRAFQSVKK